MKNRVKAYIAIEERLFKINKKILNYKRRKSILNRKLNIFRNIFINK